jgi:hypothetical protein
MFRILSKIDDEEHEVQDEELVNFSQDNFELVFNSINQFIETCNMRTKKVPEAPIISDCFGWQISSNNDFSNIYLRPDILKIYYCRNG